MVYRDARVYGQYDYTPMHGREYTSSQPDPLPRQPIILILIQTCAVVFFIALVYYSFAPFAKKQVPGDQQKWGRFGPAAYGAYLLQPSAAALLFLQGKTRGQA